MITISQRVSHKQPRLKLRVSFLSFFLSRIGFCVCPFYRLYSFSMAQVCVFNVRSFVCYTISPVNVSRSLLLFDAFVLCVRVRSNKNFFRMSCSSRYKSDELSGFSLSIFYSLKYMMILIELYHTQSKTLLYFLSSLFCPKNSKTLQ